MLCHFYGVEQQFFFVTKYSGWSQSCKNENNVAFDEGWTFIPHFFQLPLMDAAIVVLITNDTMMKYSRICHSVIQFSLISSFQDLQWLEDFAFILRSTNFLLFLLLVLLLLIVVFIAPQRFDAFFIICCILARVLVYLIVFHRSTRIRCLL